MDDPGPSPALGAGERARRPDALLANRVHSLSCCDWSIKSLEADRGRTLARRAGAPDSHSSDRGEREGDRRCRLAPSLTDRGRGYPTGIRIRGGRQSATCRHCPASPRCPIQTDSGLPRGGERTADANLERLFTARLSAGGFKLKTAPRLPNKTAVCLRSATVARASAKPPLGPSRRGTFRMPVVKSSPGCSRPAAMP